MSIGTSVSSFFSSLSRARAAQSAFTELSSLSDESLQRRGLQRNQIARVALKDLIDG